MKILSHSLEQQSRRQVTRQTSTRTRIRFWKDRPAAQSPPAFRIHLSPGGMKRAMDERLQEEAGNALPGKLWIMKTLLEKFFGIEIHTISPESLERESPEGAEVSSTADSLFAAPARKGWGLEISHSSTRWEETRVHFQARGRVSTEEGKTFDFHLDLRMSRQLLSQKQVQLKAGDALIDPLIIDIGGNGITLMNRKTAFDINNDGITDQIPTLNPGSGYLAYDQNGNGIIEDGGELFGPRSGNGFAELSTLDEDNNGWIDENDSAYYDLKIFRPGDSFTLDLKSREVGAISLSRLETILDMKNGKTRESGLFLRENGEAGLVQEVDLSVTTG